MEAQLIVSKIVSYVGNEKYSNWYVGIAADPEDCLFNRHNVEQHAKVGGWVYKGADSSQVARTAEVALHNAGFDGGPGGGDSTTTYVYAYRKTRTTSED